MISFRDKIKKVSLPSGIYIIKNMYFLIFFLSIAKSAFGQIHNYPVLLL